MHLSDIQHKNLTILFTIVCLLFAEKINGSGCDSLLNGIKLEVNAQYGCIMPHHVGIKYVMDRNLVGFEINLATESAGRHIWESIYRFPRYGMGYNFKNFGNEAILGNGHALFAFIDIPFYSSTNRFSVSYKFDIGPAYITRKYNYSDNPLNQAISKNINIFFGFDIIAHYRISNKYEAKVGFELSHYSNGKVRSPNMGLNTISLSTALIFGIIPDNQSRKQQVISNRSKHTIDLVGNMSFKRDDFLNNELYLVNTVVADYSYYFSRKYSFGGGIDYFYDRSLGVNKEYLDVGKAEKWDNYQAGSHITFTARYNKLNIIGSVGMYIWADYYRYSRIYSRLGLRYAISDRYLLNFTVKAHYAIADYIEWGIGYRFNFYSKNVCREGILFKE